MKEKMSVLIVEDESLIAFLLERYLLNLECTVAGKVIFGEEALPAWESTKPDLVLMDIKLAGPMTGLDAARSILSHGSARIAFMTAFGTDEMRREINSIDHVAYFEKPVVPEQLKELITTIRTENYD